METADFARQKFVYLTMFTLVRRLGLAAAMTAFAFAARAHAQGSYNRDVELASFDSAWTRVRDSYYDASMRGLDWVALRDSIRPQVERGRSRNDTRVAISALLSRLGESHFGILPGDSPDAAATTPRASGVAGDAGIEARFVDSLFVITRVDRGTPAQAMGIHAGWIIDEIDSLRVIDVLRSTSRVDAASRRFALVRLTLNLNNRLSGVAGETIRLVLRDGSNARRELQVSLRPTEGQLVEYAQLPPMHVRFDSDRLASGGGQCVGVIRFNMFMTPVMPRFEDAMASFNLCSGVILDLRGNLGGLGAMVMGISGHFFAEPETLGTIRMREAQMRYVANPVKVSRSGRPMQAFTGPVAVLVDDLSASTTEILASALQRLGRARVFGTPSAGQALPALMTKLPNGDRLMYVIGDYVGPGGTRLEGAGVLPDEPTPLSRDSLLAGKDDALQAAIRWIEIRARSASNSR